MTKTHGDPQRWTSKGFEAPAGTAVIGLVRRALGESSTWAPKPPPLGPAAIQKYGQPVGDTANHRLLWRVWYYGWARQQPEPRRLLLEFFRLQQPGGGHGHAYREYLTTTHGQIWWLGVLAAWCFGLLDDDSELIDAAEGWLAEELWLYDALQEGGHVLSPGTACLEPQLDLRDVLYAMIRSEAPPLHAFGKPRLLMGPRFWDDSYNAAAWVLRAMKRRWPNLAVRRREKPELDGELRIWRKGEDYVKAFVEATGRGPFLWWHARIDGQYSQSPRDGGVRNKACPFRIPDLPGADVTVVPSL